MLYSFENLKPEIDDSAYIAPTAVIIGRVKVGARSSVWFNSVLRGDLNEIVIGDETNIQDGCLLHVTKQNPVIIEQHVTVGHGAILHGCQVKSNCLIAMGAVVLDGAEIGAGSIIASGAVVSPGTIIADGSLAMGIPAKVVRQVKSDDVAKIELGWQSYVGYAGAYKKMLACLDI